MGADLCALCTQIATPPVPLALRLRATLLLGASVIYSRKVIYLAIEVESLLQRSKKLTLHDPLDLAQLHAPFSSITLTNNDLLLQEYMQDLDEVEDPLALALAPAESAAEFAVPDTAPLKQKLLPPVNDIHNLSTDIAVDPEFAAQVDGIDASGPDDLRGGGSGPGSLGPQSRDLSRGPSNTGSPTSQNSPLARHAQTELDMLLFETLRPLTSDFLAIDTRMPSPEPQTMPVGMETDFNEDWGGDFDAMGPGSAAQVEDANPALGPLPKVDKPNPPKTEDDTENPVLSEETLQRNIEEYGRHSISKARAKLTAQSPGERASARRMEMAKDRAVRGLATLACGVLADLPAQGWLKLIAGASRIAAAMKAPPPSELATPTSTSQRAGENSPVGDGTPIAAPFDPPKVIGPDFGDNDGGFDAGMTMAFDAGEQIGGDGAEVLPPAPTEFLVTLPTPVPKARNSIPHTLRSRRVLELIRRRTAETSGGPGGAHSPTDDPMPGHEDLPPSPDRDEIKPQVHEPAATKELNRAVLGSSAGPMKFRTIAQGSHPLTVARCFYEMTLLASMGLVSLSQPSPDDDITIQLLPAGYQQARSMASDKSPQGSGKK